MKRIMRVASLYLAALPALLPQAAAWGDLGHRTVAYLAQNHLKPATAQYLHAVLGTAGDDDFSDGATWPDKIKRQRPNTKVWHYIGKCTDTGGTFSLCAAAR